MSVARPKTEKAYLKRRHGSGGSGATHGAVLELLFFGAHLDGLKTVNFMERWLYGICECAVQKGRMSGERESRSGASRKRQNARSHDESPPNPGTGSNAHSRLYSAASRTHHALGSSRSYVVIDLFIHGIIVRKAIGLLKRPTRHRQRRP